jgi:hypothetical protein
MFYHIGEIGILALEWLQPCCVLPSAWLEIQSNCLFQHCTDCNVIIFFFVTYREGGAMTLSIMTFSIMTFSITTLSIKTFCILKKSDTQLYATHHKLSIMSECCLANCHFCLIPFFVVSQRSPLCSLSYWVEF